MVMGTRGSGRSLHLSSVTDKTGQPRKRTQTAIQEVERLRHSGATFTAPYGPPRWLDHYKGLQEYLAAKYRCILKNKRMVIFDLRS